VGRQSDEWPLSHAEIWIEMMKQVIVVMGKEIELVEEISRIEFAFMATAGKILLEFFGGYAGHYFKKNHPTLVPSQPLISHAAVDAQKSLHD
jgi:hypothetical protein